MTTETTRGDAAHILLKIKKFLQNSSPTIRKLAPIVGSVISISPAVPIGELHYRAKEKAKISLLKKMWKVGSKNNEFQ